MANYIDMLEEVTLKRKRRVLRVQKNINNELNDLLKERDLISEQVKGYSTMTKKIENESHSVRSQIALLAKKQAELSDEDRILHQGKKRLEADLQDIEKERAKAQQLEKKMGNKEERFYGDKENKCCNNKLKARVFQDLTGICWDYSKINGSTLKGYIRNKSTCRISEFDLKSDNPGVNAHLWTSIGNVAASK